MRILRKCEVCGEEFIATKITNKYCSKRCARVVHRKKEAEKKKKARESKKDDAQNLQSLEIASRPFLTPSDVAFLLGVSVTTVYRCFYSGTLKAVRLRRKTYVRREDLDKYFEEAGAYKKKSYKRKDDQEYYTLREIMEKYHIGRKAVWGRCDRMGIPKVYEGRNTFFSKKAVDAKFADLLEEIDVQHQCRQGRAFLPCQGQRFRRQLEKHPARINAGQAVVHRHLPQLGIGHFQLGRAQGHALFQQFVFPPQDFLGLPQRSDIAADAQKEADPSVRAVGRHQQGHPVVYGIAVGHRAGFLVGIRLAGGHALPVTLEHGFLVRPGNQFPHRAMTGLPGGQIGRAHV